MNISRRSDSLAQARAELSRIERLAFATFRDATKSRTSLDRRATSVIYFFFSLLRTMRWQTTPLVAAFAASSDRSGSSRLSTWTEDDDRLLWSRRFESTGMLAARFQTSTYDIQTRLQSLLDPEHEACQRIMGGGGTGESRTRSGTRTSGYPGRAARTPYFQTNYNSAPAPSAPAIYAGRTNRYPYSDENQTLLGPTIRQSERMKNEEVPKGIKDDGSTHNFDDDDDDWQIDDDDWQIDEVEGDDVEFDIDEKDEEEDHEKDSEFEYLDASGLNEEQGQAAETILMGQNVFLTGAAGTGKSYLLKYIVQALQVTYPDGVGKEIVVTASTGIAATHIGGVTIHSWSGVGMGKGDTDTLYKKVTRNKGSRSRWKKAKVLIIDEISMLGGELFESLDYIGRKIRGQPDKPFGGLQLVLCGDFFQLQPVSLANSGFAFQSSSWMDANIRTIELTEVNRQSGDLQFIEVLGHLRQGRCPPLATKLISKCHVSKKPMPQDGIEPTKLYCTNKDVDSENLSMLNELRGEAMTFTATDEFNVGCDRKLKEVLKNMMDKTTPLQVELKIGAQVMLTRNIAHRKLVNGSRGVVIKFVRDRQTNNVSKKAKIPLVKFSNGVFMTIRPEENELNIEGSVLVRKQLPLKLAWSLTVHKAQGMTLDRVELQLADAFAYGQVYIALSRVTSLEGLWIRGKSIPQSALKAHPDVIDFYKTLA